MQIILLFGLVLVISFIAVMMITRPSEEERRVQQRIADIEIGGSPRGVDEPADIMKRVHYSEIAWLDFLFKRFQLTRYLNSVISEANSTWTVGRLVAATLLIFVAVAWISGFWVNSLLIRIIFAALAAGIPYVVIRFQRDSRFRKFDHLLPEAIDLITRALRAGHSVGSAIEMVGSEVPEPIGPEFRKVFEQQNFGLPFRESMEDLARRVPIADLQFLVTAILVQKETGGNLVEVLEKTSNVIRERLRLKGELRIYTAQGRLTGWILGMLPFIMFLLLSLVNSQYTKVLIEDPFGQQLVVAGLILMGIGFYTIRKIVDIRV
jgi:tight adherence protein B